MIHWNISGAIVHGGVILPFVDGLDWPDVCFHVHDGFPGLSWSGGRERAGRVEPDVLDDAVEQYRRRNIGFNLLFSNHLLTQDDLCDEYGNMLLAKLHDERNGVVVCDGVLADHVRAKFPKYELIRSVVNAYLDEVIYRPKGAIIRYFEDKTEQYDLVVVPSELNLRFDILDTLDKSKLEFLVNNGCFWHCPFSGKHYGAIARAFKSPEGSSGVRVCLAREAMRAGRTERLMDHLRTYDGLQDEVGNRIKRVKTGQRVVVRKSWMTYEQIATMQRNGCSHFKLQGRDIPSEEFASSLGRFLVEYG
jgi:collagenase-like PrtC family protease